MCVLVYVCDRCVCVCICGVYARACEPTPVTPSWLRRAVSCSVVSGTWVLRVCVFVFVFVLVCVCMCVYVCACTSTAVSRFVGNMKGCCKSCLHVRACVYVGVVSFCACASAYVCECVRVCVCVSSTVLCHCPCACVRMLYTWGMVGLFWGLRSRHARSTDSNA